MFEQVTRHEPRNTLGDWILRGCIALVFVVFGAEKFPSNVDSQWIKMFQQIGAGQWFRYFTGVVEILGGVLVLIPQTATVGLSLLACTMASAALILSFILGRPGDSIVSSIFFILLVIFWWSRH